jgi:multiple sugar transport system substrate-binding protein
VRLDERPEPIRSATPPGPWPDVATGSDRPTRRRLLAAAAGAAAIVACGAPGSAGETPSGGTAAQQPAKLLWEIRGGPTYQELVEEGLKLFNQRFPKVAVETFPKEGAWQEKLLAGWAAGAGADVFQAWDDNFWRFAANGALVNVNELLRDVKKADLDDFVKGQWTGFQIPTTDIRFGVPTYINTGVLYYNKNTFRRAGVKEPDAGWAYDEFAEAARRLTRVDAGRQVYGGYHPLGKGRLENTLWAYGGNWVDPKDFKRTLAHTAESQAALNWMHDRYWKDISFLPVKQRPTGFLFWVSLGDGLYGMAEDGMHALKDVARVEGMEFDIAPIPKGPKQRLSWITTDGWGLWSGSKARPQAWELAKFLMSVEWFKLQSRIELLIPSRVSLLDDWIDVLKGKFPSLQGVNLKGVKDQLTASPPAVSTWYQFLCAADANKLVGDTLTEIFTEGTEKPGVFQTRKDQIDAAAAGCGLVLK